MIHPLDNPAWSALFTVNKDLGRGNDQGRYFQCDISPFAGVALEDPHHYQALWNLVPDNRNVVVCSIAASSAVAPFSIIDHIPYYQMIYKGSLTATDGETLITRLTAAHVPLMLELTRINSPGPFLEKTILFGQYRGIFDGQQLVAMAGHRFQTNSFVEISAVCTHPQYTGKGYARQLINSQILQITREEKTPFLHVRCDNTRAINIYEEIGFVKRIVMNIYVLKK